MKFKFTLSIGLANANQTDEIDIEDDLLEGLSPKEREDFLHEEWKQWAWNYIDGGIYPIEE